MDTCGSGPGAGDGRRLRVTWTCSQDKSVQFTSEEQGLWSRADTSSVAVWGTATSTGHSVGGRQELDDITCDKAACIGPSERTVSRRKLVVSQRATIPMAVALRLGSF